LTHRSAHFSGDCIFALRGGDCALKFLHALEIDQGYLAHTPFGTVVPPQKIFNRENLKFGLKFSVCTSITSGLMGLVGIFSPNFFRPCDELWSTNEKVTARILMHPNCSYAVSWRICQVVLFGLIHQLPLLRVEFWIPKLTFHSDLRRRAASRRALPCPSSLFCSNFSKCTPILN